MGGSCGTEVGVGVGGAIGGVELGSHSNEEQHATEAASVPELIGRSCLARRKSWSSCSPSL